MNQLQRLNTSEYLFSVCRFRFLVRFDVLIKLPEEAGKVTIKFPQCACKLGLRDLRADRSRDLISQRYKSVGSSVPCVGTNQIYWNCWAHDSPPALLQTNSTARQTRICYILAQRFRMPIWWALRTEGHMG